MPYRDVFAVNKVGCVGGVKALRLNVKTDLMTEEVKVNPFIRFAALSASNNIAVEAPCLFFVFNGVSEMKYRLHFFS